MLSAGPGDVAGGDQPGAYHVFREMLDGPRDALTLNKAVCGWNISKAQYLDSTRNAGLQELAHSNYACIRMRAVEQKAIHAGRH